VMLTDAYRGMQTLPGRRLSGVAARPQVEDQPGEFGR